MIDETANRHVLVFDVNETLLDLSALLTVVTGPYHDFLQVSRSALNMLAERRGLVLDDEQRNLILGTMRTLPPHPDVIPALEILKDAGFNGTVGVVYEGKDINSCDDKEVIRLSVQHLRDLI